MNPKSLSDIAVSRPTIPSLEIPLDQVGMEKIATQVSVAGQIAAASVNAFVSLDDAGARGIHMSRLYKLINELNKEDLTQAYVERVLEEMLVSHKGLSGSAFLQVDFDYLVKRKALKSGSEGWRRYPISIRAQKKDGTKFYKVLATVEYSSTCPCSAALTREAMQEKFAADFAGKSVNLDDIHAWLGRESSFVAAPHSQRSEAKVLFEFNDGKQTPLINLIDAMEAALGTPVQASVKREDEQEFARLNGQNLMFCEDAARKLKAALLSRPDLKDFQIEVRHFESLHAHEAVARCSKSN